MAMAKRKGDCVECGRYRPITKDHVPPQCLFAKPRPSNLITVPSCKECHEQWSKDDEWFRTRLALRASASESEDVKAITPKILRSLERPEASGMNKSFFDDLLPVEMRTKSGLYVGQSGAYQVDIERLIRIAERIVRGLIWHETKSRVDDRYEMVTHTEETLHQVSQEHKQFIVSKIISPLANRQAKVIGNDVFCYRFQTFERLSASAWLIHFYKSTGFLSVVRPRRVAGVGAQRNRQEASL